MFFSFRRVVAVILFIRRGFVSLFRVFFAVFISRRCAALCGVVSPFVVCVVRCCCPYIVYRDGFRFGFREQFQKILNVRLRTCRNEF